MHVYSQEARLSKRSDATPAIDVALVGLGTLGRYVGRLLLSAHSGVRLVAAIEEHDRSLHGFDAGELFGGEACGVRVTDHLPEDAHPAAAIVVTYSRLSAVEPMIATLLRRGVNVVTSAEELGYPWREFPEESGRLDELARHHGVSLLSAGANPGFVMDTLPAIMTLACSGIRAVRVTRTLDLTHQRRHKLAKLGVGIPPFEPRDDGEIIGHVGYRQSIDALADTLGWRLDAIKEDPVVPEVVADHPREGLACTIDAGEVAIMRHAARGLVDGVPVIDLCGYYGFVLEDDPIPKGDTFQVEGVDQSFEVQFRPGMISSVTTPAILLNLLRPTVAAAPGLRTTLDFRVGDFTSIGV